MFLTRFRALLGLMPSRAEDKTSATAITATTSVVATKVGVAMSFETSKSWLSAGLLIVDVVIILFIMLLLASAVIVIASTASTYTAFC